ncbi:hypothetical protein N780_17465 [Pontibacillus chungwhensis BH030062]|uniref:DUF7660 domain-containing protein n=1 Tax=Pontibacillus chungwhensis BH030062 TaxID=1385513 RepID=A0A0A2USY5_9BACI|nr:hypothetical protein [Pontibacillus chungwhensis]KGP91049.1 hypothetical protein N780_17465 [Pontibacillus chungwhensis BH030062]
MEIESIKSKEELISFIDNLMDDLVTNQTEWENLTLGDYLEAIKGWVEDTNSLPSNPNWTTIAKILMAGKFYE